MKNKDGIHIYDNRALEGIKRACDIASETLDMMDNVIEPEITTLELDRICHDFILSKNPSLIRFDLFIYDFFFDTLLSYLGVSIHI